MKHSHPKIDLSNDLIVLRYGNGVILVRPELIKTSPFNALPLSSLLTLPFNVYITDDDSYFYQLNISTTQSLGFISVKDSIQKSVRESATNETIKELLYYDKTAIEKNTQIIKEITFQRKSDHDMKRYLAIKFPLYDYKQNKTFGIFGVALEIDDNNANIFTDALTLLTQTNLLSQEPPHINKFITPLKLENITFTCREKDVLRLLIGGNTIKEMATKLSLSPRTIEEYINNIKNKLNVRSRSAIIEKITFLINKDYL